MAWIVVRALNVILDETPKTKNQRKKKKWRPEIKKKLKEKSRKGLVYGEAVAGNESEPVRRMSWVVTRSVFIIRFIRQPASWTIAVYDTETTCYSTVYRLYTSSAHLAARYMQSSPSTAVSLCRPMCPHAEQRDEAIRSVYTI